MRLGLVARWGFNAEEIELGLRRDSSGLRKGYEDDLNCLTWMGNRSAPLSESSSGPKAFPSPFRCCHNSTDRAVRRGDGNQDGEGRKR